MLFSRPWFLSDYRHGSLMVSVPAFGLSSLSSSPGQKHCVAFLGKTHITLKVTLSTQVYEWVPANVMLEVTL